MVLIVHPYCSAVGDAYLDECARCGGVWLDVASFERIGTSKEYQAVVTGLGSSRVDLQACKLEYSIVSPK